jgi:hypothetical protein
MKKNCSIALFILSLTFVACEKNEPSITSRKTGDTHNTRLLPVTDGWNSPIEYQLVNSHITVDSAVQYLQVLPVMDGWKNR